MTTNRDFTPALRRAELTSQYDRVVAIMTRERRWRSKLLTALSPQAGETIVDLGAGTGSMAILIEEALPSGTVIGVDPDPVVIQIARAKIAAAGHDIEMVEGFGNGESLADACADKVISSLVLHQCSAEAKARLLHNAIRLLKPGGQFLVADYGVQRTALMRMLFRQVRVLDGFDSTRANKDGEIPSLIAEAGFVEIAEIGFTNTPTGSISIYSGYKPDL